MTHEAFSKDYQELTDHWVAEGVEQHHIALIFLIAEITNQEPDYIRQRWYHLNQQVKTHIYKL